VKNLIHNLIAEYNFSAYETQSKLFERNFIEILKKGIITIRPLSAARRLRI